VLEISVKGVNVVPFFVLHLSRKRQMKHLGVILLSVFGGAAVVTGIVLLVYFLTLPSSSTTTTPPAIKPDDPLIPVHPIHPGIATAPLPPLVAIATSANDRLFPLIKGNTRAAVDLNTFISNVVQPTCGSNTVSDAFRTYVTTLDEAKLIPFIVHAANTDAWAPSVSDIKQKLNDSNEVYLTQQNVAWILANMICGNNVNQSNFVHENRHVKGNFYNGHAPSCTTAAYQLCAYFAAMHSWMINETHLAKIVIGYGGTKGSYVDAPPISANTVDVNYDCKNTLSDLPSQSIRLINSGNEPGGSYIGDLGGSVGAQEEAAFGLYPELAVGMFILPNPATGLETTATDITMSWWVFGARYYAEPLPKDGDRVELVGSPLSDFTFYPLEQDYTVFPELIIGVAGYPCNGGAPYNCTTAKTDCAACFTTLPDPIRRVYSRMFPALNIDTWPASLKAWGTTWTLNETFPYVTNPVSGGAWGCNNTMYSIVQLLVTSNANWKVTSVCVDGGEGASNICTCRLPRIECDPGCYAKQLDALQFANDIGSDTFCAAVNAGSWVCPEGTCG
jgi:hypothetical protein